MTAESKLAPIRKGLLEFLVLKIVGARSVYVPDILRQLAGTEFATQEGTLYPLLSKLRREELVQYEWKESDAGPPRKYYRLTETGRAQLVALDDYWNLINRTIANLGH
jgi:PadR family transcriptional regulator, regulatory protein PadR